jgi:hypothetical protein
VWALHKLGGERKTEENLWKKVQPKRTMKKENKKVHGRNVNKITTLLQRKHVQQL